MRPHEKWEGLGIDLTEFWRRKHAREPWLSNPSYAAIAAAVNGRSMLDVGCGGGLLIAGLRALGYTGTYYGIDVTPGAVAASRALCPDEAFDLGDAAALHLDADVVVARHVLEHHPPELVGTMIASMVQAAREAVVVCWFVPPGAEFVPGEDSDGFLEHQHAIDDVELALEAAGATGWAVERLPKTGTAQTEQELWTVSV